MRQFLYALGRLIGDVNSIRRGTIHKRVVNKLVGRHVVSRLWWK
jgi:hypothetical protein